MGGLCFIVSVHGWHMDYIPLFLYSLRKAYPEAGALVLTGQNSHISSDSKYRVENDFEGYKVTSKSPEMWRFLAFASERFEKYLVNYDYFYVTDVDYIICPEYPSLLQQHLNHCETLGLSYSTHMRVYEPKIVVARLFATRSFARAVAEVVDVFDLLVAEHAENIFQRKPRHPGERLLYKIIVQSGLRAPPRLEVHSPEAEFDILNPANYGDALFNPQHGIHLGIGRASARGYGDLLGREFYQQYFEHLRELQNDAVFLRILADMSLGTRTTVEKMLELAEEPSK